MLLFGCSGSQPQAQGVPASGQAQQQQQAGANGTAQGQQAASPPANDFARLMGLKTNAAWKVTYDVASLSNTSSNGFVVSSNMTYVATQYMKGADMRTDMVVGSTTVRSYILSGIFYSCYDIAEKWACTKYPQSAQVSTVLAQGEVEKNPGKYAAVPDGTMQLAGVTANCFNVTGLESGFTIRYCFSSEGAPLYILVTGMADGRPQYMEIKATEYSKQVLDSDFVLPAAVTGTN